MLQNWARNVTFAADRLHRPRSVEHLQDLVASARRVRALGSGHSFNRIADSSELITVQDLDIKIDIDEAASTVTVPAGARYAEVGVALAARGLALHNLGSLPHISVAGACATGTHGSGNTNRCLAAAAVAIEFVRADGELVRRTIDDADFGGSVLALGALGIATRVTLAVEPTYEMRQDVWLDAPLASVLEHFDEIMAAGYSVSLFSESARPDVVDKIWIKTRGASAVDGRRFGARPAEAPQHPITGQDTASATRQLGVVGPWQERLPHFRIEFTPSNGDEQQSEFLIPREHGAAALAAVQALDLSAAMQVFELRTVAADELWLSPCGGRDTVALHFTWALADELVQPAVELVESAIAAFDPRPHWGKVFRQPPEDVRAHYPRLPDFRALVDAHDPGRKFGNAFLESYVY